MSHPVHILITGQVDHGKSTLIGRLMHECGQMPDEAKERLENITQQYGQDNIEWAFALDSLQLERTQGITLDASRVWLKRDSKELVLIDVPGHHELLANMLTGASDAEAALVLVDVGDGVTKQTKLHARLIQLLGIKQVLIAVTKMDLVKYDQKRFELLAKEVKELFADETLCVPISAKSGDNLTKASDAMAWYQGKPLLEHLDALGVDKVEESGPFRLAVQDVTKHEDRRVITGKVAGCEVKVGDEIIACPSGSVADIKEFISWPNSTEKKAARAGESVGITLSQPIFAQRGEVLAHSDALPYFLYQSEAEIIWLGDVAMQAEKSYKLRLGTASYPVKLEADHALTRHELGTVLVRSRGLMVVDDVEKGGMLARMVIEDENHRVVAAGVMRPDKDRDQKSIRIDRKSTNISPYQLPVTSDRFEERNGHKGAVFWFSGLSGAGKSTLAVEMQKILFDRNKQVVILDGDNMRGGLARDLGFSESDRTENIRRSAEVARLFAQHGNIVMTAFITPTEADRQLAASICGHYLYQVHVKADVELCEKRDTKGLYKKARAGEIKNFTGISAPFETPSAADITIDTANSITDCIEELLYFVEDKTKL